MPTHLSGIDQQAHPGSHLRSDVCAFPALPVLECVDFVVELAGVDEAAEYVVVEVAES